jgi:hypothetical protein
MTILQIDVTGTDADGNVATATVEVEVGAPLVPGSPSPPVAAPASPASPAPPGLPGGQTGQAPHPRGEGAARASSGEEGMPAEARAEAAEPEARVMAAQQVQIPGLGNATGHKTTDLTNAPRPPVVTQAVRSTTLFRSTGGFR